MTQAIYLLHALGLDCGQLNYNTVNQTQPKMATKKAAPKKKAKKAVKKSSSKKISLKDLKISVKNKSALKKGIAERPDRDIGH